MSVDYSTQQFRLDALLQFFRYFLLQHLRLATLVGAQTPINADKMDFINATFKDCHASRVRVNAPFSVTAIVALVQWGKHQVAQLS